MATTQAMNVTVPMPNTASSMISTPSPSPSTATASHNNMARRPPRKSTLTQQQKNQKRQRATQDQLLTLEMEFNKNPTPTAGVRERIAQEINMTERSVQIWFQNRYVCDDIFSPVSPLTVVSTNKQARKNKEYCKEEHRKRRGLQ